MKSRFINLSAVLLLLSTTTFAQSAHKMDAPKTPASKSDALKSFETMKSLAGEWEGPVTTDLPASANVNIKPMHVSMKVTSRGHVLVNEFQEAGTLLDPTKYDHPVTMLYVDEG